MWLKNLLDASWKWAPRAEVAFRSYRVEESIHVLDAPPKVRATRVKHGVKITGLEEGQSAMTFSARAVEQLAILSKQRIDGELPVEGMMRQTRERATRSMKGPGYAPPPMGERLDEKQDAIKMYTPPVIKEYAVELAMAVTDKRFAETDERDAKQWLRSNGWRVDSAGWTNDALNAQRSLYGEGHLNFETPKAAYEWAMRGRVTCDAKPAAEVHP